MAKAKIVHSDDAVLIEFKGRKSSPEPTTGIIRFPGGHVEVSRCSDGSYFAHIQVVDPANVIQSRLDFKDADEIGIRCVQDIPNGSRVEKIALKIKAHVDHPVV